MNPEDENYRFEKVSGEALVAQVLENTDIPDQIEFVDENIDVAPFLPSSNKQLVALALCKRMCDTYDAPRSICRHIALLQRTVRQERSNTHQQTMLARLLQESPHVVLSAI